MSYIDYDRVGINLSSDLSKKVVNFRNEFYDFFYSTYVESFVNMFHYNIKPFDKSRLELALRQGLGVCVGKNRFGQVTILGFIQSSGFNTLNPYIFLKRKRYTGRDIKFTINNSLIEPRYKTSDFKEIWEQDAGATGDFVVFWNKQLQLSNDFKKLQHYSEKLAEIEGSRFSLILQAKAQTILTGEVGDETYNQMISAIYNGSPFVKMANTFDVDDDIIKFDNTSLSTNLQQLKTEYQTTIAELNAYFGVNVLAVDKDSGVSDAESNGNLGYVTTNGNIYLESRKKALDLLNARYNLNYSVSFDSNSVGILGGTHENNNNDWWFN